MAKNQIFKKRTFFGRRFLPCRVGGFSPNFNWTYPGLVKNFPWVRFLISHSVQKLADFAWKWANFQSWFFANFPAKTWKSAKNFFLKFLALIETVDPYITFFAISLTVLATSCKIKIAWLKLAGPQSDPSHLHDHGFLLRLAALGFFQKPLIKT